MNSANTYASATINLYNNFYGQATNAFYYSSTAASTMTVATNQANRKSEIVVCVSNFSLMA